MPSRDVFDMWLSTEDRHQAWRVEYEAQFAEYLRMPAATLTQPYDWAQVLQLKRNRKEEDMSIETGQFTAFGAATQVAKELDKALLAREVARQLAAYDALGEDTYPDLTILKFTLRYQDTDKDYTFGALKVRKTDTSTSHWHLTDGATYTWDTLKRLLAKADPTPVLVVMVEQGVGVDLTPSDTK